MSGFHQLQIPEKLVRVFFNKEGWNPTRYKGAYGGRGSGKTRTFAKMTAVRAVQLSQSGVTGVILCGRELQNSLDDSSFAEIKFAIQEDEYLSQFFDVGERYIRTKCGRISYVFQGLRHNIDSIKSKSRILICWIDEADPVTDECWRKVIPTVREQGSEIWVTWNPERKGSTTDERFRQDPPDNSSIVEINWQDNPWFKGTALNEERIEDKEKRPDTYEHIWEGGYLEVKPGSYFTRNIQEAKDDGRWLVDVPENKLHAIRIFVDIGGTGAKSDNFVMWAAQFVGLKILLINHYEAQGQEMTHHVQWLNENGYVPGRAEIVLPHDGDTNEKTIRASYASKFEDLGYKVTVVPNQGKGAAKQRVEYMRDRFNQMWFDRKCEAGCSALAYYSKKIDEARGIDLGPDHNWASHSCLPSGVKVKTSRGLVEIQDVTPYDFVDINGIYARVTNSGYIKHSNTLTITLNTGEEIECTPEHKIFTTRGLLGADELSYNDVISTERRPLWNMKKLSIAGIRKSITESTKGAGSGFGGSVVYMLARRAESLGCFIGRYTRTLKEILGEVTRFFLRMAIPATMPSITSQKESEILGESKLPSMSRSGTKGKSFTESQTGITSFPISAAGHTCTDTCGVILTDQYQKSTTSTILTGISQTIGSKTSSAYTDQSTQGCIQELAHGSEAKRIKNSSEKLQRKPRNGIDQKREGSGTQSTQRDLTKKERNTSLFARIAGKITRRISLKGLFTAQASARVSHIRINTEVVPVYDITVEKQQCYYANGVLVSNSDAIGMCATVYEEPKEFKPLNYQKINTA